MYYYTGIIIHESSSINKLREKYPTHTLKLLIEAGVVKVTTNQIALQFRSHIYVEYNKSRKK